MLSKNKKIKFVLSLMCVLVLTVTSVNFSSIADVYAASNVTGIEVDTTSDVLLYVPDGVSGYSVADTENIYTDLSGGTEYEKIEYSFESKNIDGIASSNLFKVTKSTTGSASVVSFSSGKASVVVKGSSTDIPTFYVTAGSLVTEGAVLNVTVSMWVKNRENPYVRRCQISAETGLVPLIGASVNASKNFITVDEDIVITNKIEPANSNANVKYTLTKPGTAARDIVSGGVHRLKSTDGKILYATYNEKTGYFKAEVSGKYMITPSSTAWLANTSYTYPATIYVVGTSFNNIAVEEGRTSGNIAGLKDATGTLNTSSTYVTYEVEDKDIASVSYNSSSYGTKLSVTGKKIGFTKITATIKTYDNLSSAGTFTKTAYVVVAPKSSDKTFDLNNVKYKEAYLNELVLANKANQAVLKSAVKNVINGNIDCGKLSYEAYELVEECMQADYPYYYSTYATSKVNKSTVFANGLMIAFADEDTLSKKDPTSPEELKFVCSDVLSQYSSYKMKNAVTSFTAALSVKNSATQIRQLWISVTNSSFNNGDNYVIYLDGKAISTVEAADKKVKFLVNELGTFSIVKSQTAIKQSSQTAWLNEETLAIAEKPTLNLEFFGYVQGYGEVEESYDNATGIINVGTHGESRRIESLEVTGIEPENILMMAHVQNIGDMSQYVREDGTVVVGYPGEGLRMEAFSIELLNDYAKYYDIYYRVHVKGYGWLGWAKNGEVAGTSGHSFRIESIEIKVVEKGKKFDESLYKKTQAQGNRGKDGSASYMDR